MLRQRGLVELEIPELGGGNDGRAVVSVSAQPHGGGCPMQSACVAQHLPLASVLPCVINKAGVALDVLGGIRDVTIHHLPRHLDCLLQGWHGVVEVKQEGLGKVEVFGEDAKSESLASISDLGIIASVLCLRESGCPPDITWAIT